MANSADTYIGGSSGRSVGVPRPGPACSGEATLCFQPVVGLLDGHVGGLHASSTDPERGSSTLAESCRLLAIWRRTVRDARLLSVAVRLDPRLLGRLDQPSDPTLPAEVAAALRAGDGLPPANLRLEVPERVVLEDPRAWSAALGAIRSLGVELCIADFGRSFRSFSHLRLFPVDAVKIGRELVDGVGARDRAEESLVAAVIAAARPLGLQVVADGVERPEQARRLRALGCDAAQGPLYGEPLSGGRGAGRPARAGLGPPGSTPERSRSRPSRGATPRLRAHDPRR